MEYLSVRTDNLNQPTPTLPPPGQRLSIFSFGGASRLSSRVELAFFRERSRGINAERFLFSRAFSDKSLRGDPSARSLRLAPRSLGRDDKQRAARQSRASGQGEELDLGPCCACEKRAGVRSIFMLHYRCAIPGHGWGCVVCGLPSDGASYVLCDKCLGPCDINGLPIHPAKAHFSCRGYPATEGRELISITECRGKYDHNRTAHAEEL